MDWSRLLANAAFCALKKLLKVCIVDSRDKPIVVAVAQVEWSSDINWLRGGTMNRRGFLASVAALPGAAMFPDSLAQPEQQITHVDTKTSSPSL